MATIKMFSGTTPPSLKKGEWASDGYYAYLGMEHGEYKVFQGVFDLSDDQFISGFQYDINKKAILIPSGTPFSKLQSLFDTLPKALKYTSDSKASIDILFNDGTYINDLGTPLVLRDFNYQINIKSLSNTVDETTGKYEKPVIFQLDNAIEIYNSAVNFSDIRFEYEDANFGAISFLNCSTNINDCCFDAKIGGASVSDKGYNKLVFSECFFKMFADEQFSILDKAVVGSVINLARSKSDENYRPKSVALWLFGGIIIVGNVDDLKLSKKSQFDPTFGGIEIHNGFVMDIDGQVDVDIPKKISDLLNDTGFTNNYNLLTNTPVTITAEQATAIETNTTKRSFAQADEDKLAAIEKNATNGADWVVNVSNKPATITPEQATAIEANTEKRTYPEADETKLSGIEENATVGANWSTNITNKPVTISEEQATAIEANTSKRSYPETDENKLLGIEENATVGGDWEVNISNKPITISEEQASAIEANTLKRSYSEADETKLGGIEENATSGADWSTNIANKPTTISEEQTTAIEANTSKRSYPETDENKLSGIEENATNGADWATNLQNKPDTITAVQAEAIEANTEKISYPQADADKLATIEENATVGGDWEVNISNKPITISEEQATAIEANTEKRSYPEADETKLGGIEENATAGAGWDAVQNKPAVLDLLITALEQAGVTEITIDADGKHIRFQFD